MVMSNIGIKLLSAEVSITTCVRIKIRAMVVSTSFVSISSLVNESWYPSIYGSVDTISSQ